jgi:polysaccharide export outer membrane protein
MNAIKKIAGMVVVILLAGSCVPIKKLSYVQEDKTMRTQQMENMYFIDGAADNEIRPADELYIRVTSADEGQTAFNDASSERMYDPSVISYTVDEEGYIKLPYVSRIKLSGLTLVEASDKMEEELSQYLYFPSVFVRFVNNKVTILGEVGNPGVYVFNYKSINILQAIGYAGDIGIFGNRREVLIVRDQGDYRSKHVVDLTSDVLLTSPYYMLKSNDIIYVEPLKSKKWGMEEFPYDLLFSLVSLTVVVLTFMVTYLN